MSTVVKFAPGKEFTPGPQRGAGKIGRKCPRWPKELKAVALGCAVAIAGTEEALERDRGWAGMGLNPKALAQAVDQVLPGALMRHAHAFGYERDTAEEYLYNRVFRMYNCERKRAPRRMRDDGRGGRSDEHLFRWEDKADWMPAYERARQFGTK